MKKVLALLPIVFLLILSFSVSKMVSMKYKSAKEYEVSERPIQSDAAEQNVSETVSSDDEDAEPVYNAFCDELSKENNDFAGWLSIDGTNIDYPLMMSPDNPDYYLKRDFYKKESVSGTPYIGKDCTLESDNAVIYGHNMENGTMFSDLMLFKSEEFCKEHSKVLIQTVNENAEYDIVAVFKEKVHYQDESNVFRYYDYAGDLSSEDFDKYVSTIKGISLYDTGITAKYGDKLISLSTCSHLSKNGRFVIVAVKHSSPKN